MFGSRVGNVINVIRSVNHICICDMKNRATLPIMPIIVPSFALIGVECKGNDHTSHHLTPTEAGGSWHHEVMDDVFQESLYMQALVAGMEWES